MAIRIPANTIVTSKYTAGNELVVESTNVIYVGYYYELNNNLYAGKTFDSKAPKLILIKDRNTLLNRNNSLATFSIISGITSQQLQTPNSSGLPNTPLQSNNDIITKFYYKKINEPNLIKEISEDDFKSLQTNPIYQTISIQFIASPSYINGIPQNLDQADQQMPGIKTFLLG